MDTSQPSTDGSSPLFMSFRYRYWISFPLDSKAFCSKAPREKEALFTSSNDLNLTLLVYTFKLSPCCSKVLDWSTWLLVLRFYWFHALPILLLQNGIQVAGHLPRLEERCRELCASDESVRAHKKSVGQGWPPWTFGHFAANVLDTTFY